MKQDSIYLCGSMPLNDARDVFSTVAETLGSSVKRIPDGETGDRLVWIRWQDHVFRGHPQLDAIESEGDYRNATAVVKGPDGERPMAHTTWWRLKDGIAPEDLEFGPLGYADSAIESYKDFAELKQNETVHADAKFLISVPSPYNVINSAVAPDNRILVEPAYEKRMAQEIAEVSAALPHDQISWQWDCAHDMQAFDGARESYFPFHWKGIAARLIKMGELVPTDIELGYHLCYGSFGGKHFVEPVTMKPMVDLTNRICADINRTVEFMHMPVPIERDDDVYFESLANLKMKPETRLYLGVVHDKDGAEGTRRRMATADKYAASYGIATECGFGRRPYETVKPLLELHAEVAG